MKRLGRRWRLLKWRIVWGSRLGKRWRNCIYLNGGMLIYVEQPKIRKYRPVYRVLAFLGLINLMTIKVDENGDPIPVVVDDSLDYWDSVLEQNRAS